MAFSIQATAENGFELIELIDLEAGTRVAVIPNCGALLHGFTVQHPEGAMNVIDHYDDLADFVSNVTNKGFKSCKMTPFACRIRNSTYQFNGHEYTFSKFKLGNHAIHGLIYDQPFTVTEQLANDTAATVVMNLVYRGEQAGYPFHFDCTVQYQLTQQHTLSITTTILNTSNEAIPMQDGWHPYFTLGGKVDALVLQVPTTQQVVMDAEVVPTGELVPFTGFSQPTLIGSLALDDCYVLDQAFNQPACVLNNPANGLQLTITADAQYPYMQLYTPPHRNSLAIENLSAIPDAFNNGIGLKILAPAESWVLTTIYQIQINL